MHTKLTIPERLKDLRVSEKKMSLQELSDATGIPCSTLGNYERDENVDMSLSSLLTLADFYHVSTDYLLCFTDYALFPAGHHITPQVISFSSVGRISSMMSPISQFNVLHTFIKTSMLTVSPFESLVTEVQLIPASDCRSFFFISLSMSIFHSFL